MNLRGEMRNQLFRSLAILCVLIIATTQLQAQFLMDMIDTTKDLGRGMLGVYNKFDHIRISGYMQPQYQVASDTGISSYSGGNFAPNSNNRFTLRRGRIRFDYARFTRDSFPSLQFVFQFDGSERGVFIRDFWGRVWENKYHVLAFTTGMFARPFGYEVNLSSSDREAPERGRMSQILMKTERDLGAMVSFEPQKKDNPLYHLKLDAGLFNGQGLTAPAEFDSYKDFIGQVYWKPTKITGHLYLGGGVSMLNGGMRQSTPYRYETKQQPNGQWVMVADSGHSEGSKVPRKYYGANAQLKLKNKWGATELRGEYWQGTQPGQKATSETYNSNLASEAQYVREFHGGFISFLQNIINDKNQLVLKYDWYDPNTKVSGSDIGLPGSHLNLADAQYHTFGFGGLHYFSSNLKFLLFYEIVKNEITSLPGATKDISDNVLTCRMQFRF